MFNFDLMKEYNEAVLELGPHARFEEDEYFEEEEDYDEEY